MMLLQHRVQQSSRPLADVHLAGPLTQVHQDWHTVAKVLNDKASVQWHFHVIGAKGDVQQDDAALAILQQDVLHEQRHPAHDKLLRLLKLSAVCWLSGSWLSGSWLNGSWLSGSWLTDI